MPREDGGTGADAWVRRVGQVEAERDAARAQSAALAEALESIRYRYFPVGDEERVAWATQTFEIAKAAIDAYRTSRGSSDAT